MRDVFKVITKYLWKLSPNIVKIRDTIYNGDNSKLRMFLFIQERPCLKPYFMTNATKRLTYVMHNEQRTKNKVFN